MEEAASSPNLVAGDMSVLVGLGEPSACSIGGGAFRAFDAGARGTLADFFCGVLELDRFL
jgi:hypothetical protein